MALKGEKEVERGEEFMIKIKTQPQLKLMHGFEVEFAAAGRRGLAAHPSRAHVHQSPSHLNSALLYMERLEDLIN